MSGKMFNSESDGEALSKQYQNDDFLEELLDERARELCFESKRKFDFFRFNKYEERLGRINPDAGEHNASITKTLKNWAPTGFGFRSLKRSVI